MLLDPSPNCSDVRPSTYSHEPLSYLICLLARENVVVVLIPEMLLEAKMDSLSSSEVMVLLHEDPLRPLLHPWSLWE